MVKFHKYPKTNDLVEAFQYNAMRFAFVTKLADGSFQACHAPAQCREYFNEILMANFHDDFKFVATYGMEYLVKDFPIDKEETNLFVSFVDKESCDVFIRNLGFLNSMEVKANVEPTKVLEIDGNPHALIVQGSKFWMKKCVLFNLYTLFIKLASLGAGEKSYEELKENYRQDPPSELNYIGLVGGVQQFTKIVQNVPELAALPTKYIDGSDGKTPRRAYDVHTNSGIVYFMSRVKFGLKNMEESLNKIGQEFKRISESKEAIGKVFGVLK